MARSSPAAGAQLGLRGLRRIALGASTVEVRLLADAGGTRVEVEHRDLPAGTRRPAGRPTSSAFGVTASGGKARRRGHENAASA
jgi:hypothetical protein